MLTVGSCQRNPLSLPVKPRTRTLANPLVPSSRRTRSRRIDLPAGQPRRATAPQRLPPGRRASHWAATPRRAERPARPWGRITEDEPPHRAARWLAAPSRQASLVNLARRRPAGPPRCAVPSCLPGCGGGEWKTRRRRGETVASSHLPGSRAEPPDLPRRRGPVARPWSCAGSGSRA